MRLAQGKTTARIEKGLAFVAAATSAWNTAGSYYNKYRDWVERREYEGSYFLILTEEDDQFIADQIKLWAYMQRDVRTDDQFLYITEHPTQESLVPTMPPSSIPVKFQIEGRKFTFSVTTKDPQHAVPGVKAGEETQLESDRRMMMAPPSKMLLFECESVEDREFLFLHIEQKFLDSGRDQVQTLFRPSSNSNIGGWRHGGRLRKRNPDTLIHRGNLYEEIRTDVQGFLDAENHYNDMGIPWHRGYLLEGPPGTGKTSTVTTLATDIGVNVYKLAMSDVKKDAELVALAVSIPEESILLIEDIDAFKVTNKRKGEDGESTLLTLSGLLNVLDGADTPHGLITFLTTNHEEFLDPALMRPGRVDRRFHIGYLDEDQLNRMVARFVGEFPRIKLSKDSLTPTEVTECLKSGLDESPEYVAGCIARAAGDVTWKA